MPHDSDIAKIDCNVRRPLLRNRSDKFKKKTKKTKKTIRRKWTKDDVRMMKSMAKQKSGVAKISKALKRTPGAVTQRAHSSGISLSMRA